MNAYITSQIQYLVETLSPSDLAAFTSLLNSGGLTSVTSLDGLPSAVQTVIRDAFLDGVRWSFVSLIPWLGLGCVLSVFLSRISDSDKEGGSGDGNDVEHVEMEAGTGGDVEARAEVST